MFKKNILFVLCVFLSVSVNSQNRKREKRDSTIVRDSSYIYNRIQTFSKKRKITQLIYSMVFRPVTPSVVVTERIPDKKNDKKKKVATKKAAISPFEGKVIRNIQIVTYDPFGYDTRDTSLMPYDFLSKTGNALHVKTMPLKIRNLLIVKRYDTYDSLRVKECERLIRSQNYIREVTIQPVVAEGDSVDLFVQVYDVWSIIAVGSYSPSTLVVDVRDKNFAGLGHQFRGNYKYLYQIGKSAYKADYYIPNISNTYINSDLHYAYDENSNYSESASLNRPFYSVYTSWAGGVSLSQNLNRAVLYKTDSSQFLQTYKSNSQNYWIGKSWQLFKGRTEEQRATNLIASLRFYRIHYMQRAAEEYDILHSFANEEFYLAGIGVSKRLYKQDNYIFRYGSTEDVPAGRAFSFVGGYQIKEKVDRLYLGARIYAANYHYWGYFNMYAEYGTFLRGEVLEEGSLITGINSFTGLIRPGNWKLRLFIKPQCTFGFNRKTTDYVTLNSEVGIRGFNSVIPKGTQKLTLTFQLQSYAPWNLVGFRFGPYLVCSFGMLGTEIHGFRESPLYSSFGIGLLIKNDYLITSSFQISIAYYPVIPGIGNNVIKVNPVKASDFGSRNFDIDQPSTIVYQ
jgi:hypothetical protein